MTRTQRMVLILLIVLTASLTLGFLIPGFAGAQGRHDSTFDKEHLAQQIGLACIPLILGTVATMIYARRARQRRKGKP